MKIAILGASRGLGAALAAHIHRESPESVLMLCSRQEENLKVAASRLDWVVKADFSTAEDQDKVIQVLREFLPDKIFYVAGGGPYGQYETKAWKDHLWALSVNLIFPAKLIHALMMEELFRTTLEQVVMVGSAIAGHLPDPKASSYAAAKHGLRGLITSIQKESPWLDLRLYEPGYMDTLLLPPNAWPRQQGLAKSPHEEARQLWRWSQSAVD